MHIGTIIYTFFNGKLAGKDEFGNCYFEAKCAGSGGRRKRWVMYKGMAEPSKVPPEWHGWLHYTADAPLTGKHSWQKAFLPNLTGTNMAYMPPGHIRKGAKRDKATGDYEAWRP